MDSEQRKLIEIALYAKGQMAEEQTKFVADAIDAGLGISINDPFERQQFVKECGFSPALIHQFPNGEVVVIDGSELRSVGSRYLHFERVFEAASQSGALSGLSQGFSVGFSPPR